MRHQNPRRQLYVDYCSSLLPNDTDPPRGEALAEDAPCVCVRVCVCVCGCGCVCVCVWGETPLALTNPKVDDMRGWDERGTRGGREGGRGETELSRCLRRNIPSQSQCSSPAPPTPTSSAVPRARGPRCGKPRCLQHPASRRRLRLG